MRNSDDERLVPTGGSDRHAPTDSELERLHGRLRWAQDSQALAVRILTLLNQRITGKEAIRSVLRLVKEFTGFEAVAIRLREGEDFPYFVTNGFPDWFVEAERYLCNRNEADEIVRDSSGKPILECMCGNILCARTNPAFSFFTEGGSFWSCHTTELLATTTEADRQARTRNRCNSSGYESVALIPLRSDNETIGLLQLNDSRKDCFTLDMITFFEGLGASIGIVLARMKAEEALRKSGEVLETIVAERTEELRKANESLQAELVERRRAEEALRESEESYGSLFKNMREGLAHCRMLFEDGLPKDFVYLNVNDSFYRLTGLKNVINRKVTEVIPGIRHSNPELFDMCGRVVRNGDPEKLETYVQPLGIWLSISVYSPQADHFVALFDNITERKQAEIALKMSEERYKAVFENASVGIDMVDAKGRFLEVNDALIKMLGYSRDELMNMTFFDVSHLDDVESSRRYHEEMVGGRAESYRFTKRYVTKRGDVVWADVNVYSIRDSAGDYVATIGVISDITQRMSAEAERERLASAIEQAGETIVITNTQGTILYVNPAFEAITGYSSKEAVGKTPRILKSGEHDGTFYKNLWKTIKGGEIWSGRLINRRKNGQVYHEEATISPVRDSSGKIVNFVAVKRDITEHLELSRQLQQAQKMEAIGTLAGGVAHDFNNILQLVLGYSELILGDGELPGPYRSDLTKINESARRGADLVQRLLTFSRKTEIKSQPLNLNRRITELRKMLERAIPKMIHIELSLSEHLAAIQADPTQIDQVLMNLAVNARDAMPEGGQFLLETANVVLDEEYARAHLEATPGHYVLLTVTDTGSGMGKDTLEHIFEPFYTTKAAGEGTGLGLAMVHGIVKHHGGYVTCYSEPGRGTTFKIYFPALVADEKEEESTIRPIPRGGSETILLVDDEALIRNLGSRILAKAGYTVIEALDGQDALEIYRRRRDEIAVVLLDLIMPTMGGKQCLESLMKLNPSIKVVIASGFAANGPTRDALAAGAKGFVSKPYDIREMLAVVREVLDAQ